MNYLELTSWSSFKDICITRKNLNNQYTETADYYDLYGPDANNIVWHLRIRKADEAAEFESTYKFQFNWAVGARGYAFVTSDFIYNGSGVLATATKNAATDIDFQIPGTAGTFQYINGAQVITQNAAFGDWASSKIIDIDNILGYGANTILSSYIQKWYIDPASSLNLVTQYAGKVPAGVYVRVTYNSVGTVNDVGVAINFKLHTPI